MGFNSGFKGLILTHKMCGARTADRTCEKQTAYKICVRMPEKDSFARSYFIESSTGHGRVELMVAIPFSLQYQ